MSKNNLASITKALLYFLFAAILAAMITTVFLLPFIMDLFKDEYAFSPGYQNFILIFLLVSGAGALWIIGELIAMLNTLKKDAFIMRNAKALKRIGIIAEAYMLLFLMKCIVFFTPMTAVCALVMLLCGLFALILSEIFKRAVQYKEENDLTI